MHNLKLTLERIQSYFKQRPNHFLIRLVEQATLTVSALEALQDYMNKPSE